MVELSSHRAAISIHPFEVLIYATKHGHHEISNKAAYQALSLWPDEEITSRLMDRPDVFLAWVSRTWTGQLVKFEFH